MISSEDVRHVTFDKAFQGYRREDVDDYLKQVAQAMDDLAAQNDDLQKKLVMLAQRIEKYRTMENSLSTSMINAQRMGDSIIHESKQKAAEIIRSANIKAEDREQRARDDVELAKQEIVTLKGEADSFKRSLIEMYRKHINLINKLQENIQTAFYALINTPKRCGSEKTVQHMVKSCRNQNPFRRRPRPRSRPLPLRQSRSPLRRPRPTRPPQPSLCRSRPRYSRQPRCPPCRRRPTMSRPQPSPCRSRRKVPKLRAKR